MAKKQEQTTVLVVDPTNLEAAEAIIIEQLYEVSGVDKNEVTITRETTFGDDLDMDSLDLVEGIMAFEEALGIIVEEEELEGITDLLGMMKLVEAKFAKLVKAGIGKGDNYTGDVTFVGPVNAS